MAINTYPTLVSSISDWLGRSDLDTRIPDFITLAEARLSRALRVRDMEQQTAGNLTVSGEESYFALPADYLEWIRVIWAGTTLGRNRDMQYREPDSEEWRFRYRPNGDPQMFSVMFNRVYIRPAPGGAVNQFVLFYYQSLPPLVTNITNWLLTRSPDLYLYSSLAEAANYMKDDARAQEYMSLANAEAQRMVMDADSNKMSRRPYRTVETQDRAEARSKEAGVLG